MIQRKTLWYVFGLLCIGFVGYRLFLLYQIIHADHPRPPIIVSTSKVQLRDIPSVLKTVGQLDAVRCIDVMSEVSGRVQKIFYQSSQDVEQNNFLVQLNSDSEQAELKRHQADLVQAKANFERSSALIKKNVESQAQFEQKQAAFDAAQAQVSQTKSNLQKKSIRAPFSGKLGIDRISIGQYLRAGDKIVTLTDLSMLNVDFSLPEKDLSLIYLGQKIIIRVDAFPNQNFTGIVTGIEPQISKNNQSILIQASLDNPQGILMPGMFTEIDVLMQSQPQVLTLAETAVDYTVHGTSVFIVSTKQNDKNGKVEATVKRQPIKVGRRYHNVVEVLQGLNQNDTIVSVGQMKLYDGAPIIIDNTVQLEAKKSYTH